MENTRPVDLGINYLQYRHLLKIESRDGQNYVWDSIRKKLILLQPEEFVRQLFILWLIHGNSFSKNLIALEKQFTIHNLIKRFDLVLYDRTGNPQLLAEFKSHREPLNQLVFDQISVYHHAIAAPFLLITNGVITYLGSIHPELQTYTFESTPEKLLQLR